MSTTSSPTDLAESAVYLTGRKNIHNYIQILKERLSGYIDERAMHSHGSDEKFFSLSVQAWRNPWS